MKIDYLVIQVYPEQFLPPYDLLSNSNINQLIEQGFELYGFPFGAKGAMYQALIRQSEGKHDQ